MKALRTLVFLAVIVVVFLIIIDSIDAGKKEAKKKKSGIKYGNGIGQSKSRKNENLKKPENAKIERSKRGNEYKMSSSEDLGKEEIKLENSKNIGKKGKKTISSDDNIKDENPTITKTYQKVKKYKIIEDLPPKKFSSNKRMPKKKESQHTYKQEIVDEIFKSIKKNSQKKTPPEGKCIGDARNEELNRANEEKTIFVEEENLDNNQRKKKYKLIEIAENEENQDENEHVAKEYQEPLEGIQRTESEEVIEKFKTTHTLKVPKTKKNIPNPTLYSADNEQGTVDEDDFQTSQDETSESITNDDTFLDDDNYYSRYEDLHDPGTLQRCKPLPENPNRQGPRKLTLYVIEEEVDGEMTKRVVSEEDGVTMCEVAELMEKHYYGESP